jgi:predicted DNA-binding transcriptional regulator
MKVVKDRENMASKDQMIGAGILIVSIVIIVLYLYWLFFTTYWQWAITIPVLIIVLAVLLIAAWIGYTMATTPPPKPLEDIPELKETEEKK